MTKAKDQRSQSMKEQAYNVDRDKDHKSLMTKAISLISRRSVTMNSLRGRFGSDKLSSDTSLVSTVKDTTDAEINSLLDIKIQSELRVAKLEKDVSELKKVDHFAEALVTLKSQVPTVVDSYLGSKFGDVLQKELQKHTTDFIQKHSVKPTPVSSKIQTPTINLEQGSEKSASEILKIKMEQVEKQKMPKYTIKSADKATLKEYDLKSALYQTMHENKSFNRNPANHKLYHALMEGLIEDENAMDKEVADTFKDHKRKHDDDDDDDDDEDPLAGPK
ncbi:hypothetical protein Tco_0417420 [Tanacetum coccineum]